MGKSHYTNLNRKNILKSAANFGCRIPFCIARGRVGKRRERKKPLQKMMMGNSVAQNLRKVFASYWGLFNLYSCFSFNSTEKVLPLHGPLPLADTLVALPLAHVRAHALPNNSEYDRQ
jgi:hypothetical protein